MKGFFKYVFWFLFWWAIIACLVVGWILKGTTGGKKK